MTASALGLVRRHGARAGGAVTGQLSQAVGSFALQVVAAHTLGAAGLGRFATLYGAILVGTAVSTGLVGDSLTVLDRTDPRIRAALSRWCLLVACGAAAIAAVVAVAFGALGLAAGVLFGLATATFLVEDTVRRLLMATGRFWSLPVVDGTSLVVSLGVLLGVRVASGELTLGVFMLALLAGQVAATAIGLVRVPVDERGVSPRGDAAMREVFGYGAWRSVQLTLRPGTLTAARVVIAAVAGAVAFGELEAARVFMAPALLLVSGFGSYLLTLFVRQRDHSAAVALRRSDQVAMMLLVGTLALGGLGTLAAPYLGDLITGGAYRLDVVAVFGWAVYAASSAALLPYTSLAAVRGAQRRVTMLRLFDPVLSLVLVYVVSTVVVAGAPYALAAASFLAGVIIRWGVLRPRANSVARCSDMQVPT